MSDGHSLDVDEQTALAPTEAFGLLAHETRMAAMRALWEAGEALRFSEIADRAGIADTDNFSYHLDKLVDHFVRKDEEAYTLTRSGRQAMTAVLAGDVTEQIAIEPVRLDLSCPYCGADVELVHDGDDLRVVCSACEGSFRRGAADHSKGPNPTGTVSRLPFPAGGVRDREPRSILDAALTRTVSTYRDMGNGVCPDCGGPVESTMTACASHEDEDVCEACGARFAGHCTLRCRTCGMIHSGALPLMAMADPSTIAYFQELGVDLLDPTWQEAAMFLTFDEHVHRTDPLEYEATWSLGAGSLSLVVDGDGEDIEVVRDTAK